MACKQPVWKCSLLLILCILFFSSCATLPLPTDQEMAPYESVYKGKNRSELLQEFETKFVGKEKIDQWIYIKTVNTDRFHVGIKHGLYSQSWHWVEFNRKWKLYTSMGSYHITGKYEVDDSYFTFFLLYVPNERVLDLYSLLTAIAETFDEFE
jgi:hypothetical protein